jgi:hypothetical protein
LKARTGELTPPGIKTWAAAKISWDLDVFKGVILTKAGSSHIPGLMVYYPTVPEKGAGVLSNITLSNAG